MLCEKMAKEYDISVAEVDFSKADRDGKAFEKMLSSDPVLQVISSSPTCLPQMTAETTANLALRNASRRPSTTPIVSCCLMSSAAM
jgi:hypothetical protein